MIYTKDVLMDTMCFTDVAIMVQSICFVVFVSFESLDTVSIIFRFFEVIMNRNGAAQASWSSPRNLFETFFKFWPVKMATCITQ